MTEPPDTRSRIMAAALDTIREVGITGASARAIASRGDFNQALIFYHFGSVANLLIEAAKLSSADRVEVYREVTDDVTSLADLVEVARRLHADSTQDGSVAVLTQLMAGAANDPEMGAAVLEGFEGWISLVEDALRQTTAEGPIGALLPARETAYAISALFLGIELMERLDPAKSEAESVFDALGNLAGLIETVLPVMAAQFGVAEDED